MHACKCLAILRCFKPVSLGPTEELKQANFTHNLAKGEWNSGFLELTFINMHLIELEFAEWAHVAACPQKAKTNYRLTESI